MLPTGYPNANRSSCGGTDVKPYTPAGGKSWELTFSAQEKEGGRCDVYVAFCVVAVFPLNAGLYPSFLQCLSLL